MLFIVDINTCMLVSQQFVSFKCIKLKLVVNNK